MEVGLVPSETVVAETGAMNYMDDGITFEAKMGDGSNPGGGMLDSLLSVGKRVLTGESIFSCGKEDGKALVMALDHTAEVR